MTQKDDVAKTLADHERRLIKLESILSKPSSPSKSAHGIRSTLPQHILKLRDSGFFSQPRTADDTHKKLMPTYQCEPDRVAMALLRLAARKKLRKASKIVNKRRFQAYVW